MNQLTKLFVGLLCWTMIATACGKRIEKAAPAPEETITAQNNRAGLGMSQEAPVGADFRLPRGISVVRNEIKGYDYGSCECRADQEHCRLGAGELVRLCFRLRNTTAAPVTVTLPEGLVFISENKATQNGLLVRSETFTIPAGTTVAYNLALFCLNADRKVTVSGDRYRIGPVTQHPGLMTVILTLRDKDLENEHNKAIAQEAIWEVTKGNALSAAQHGRIAQLPHR
ncbi:hypothetical protein ACFOTA_07075 [Chitinophaga sp. GCM10012297]|uniref:DUF11 domain-containing protein n=1 Tax=Chitinophaga chungangae TaxID=2821488 RepID=A0ABS3YBC2_9BACT|nr:hypothetical protein [Chitinophaga chungangae]MBO9151962.1 hypothetical protein [Chitinophaga chungangae]